MITVMELISCPIFQNFTIISDTSGLTNQVSGTGIFEWESEDDINKTFNPGEFVMTTLSAFQKNSDEAEKALKVLIRKHVSAISIKTIYYQQLSSEFIKFANAHHIPIFLFSDIYFDDIIFTVKNALITNNTNHLLAEKALTLAKYEREDGYAEKLAKDINPFFLPHNICCLCSFQSYNDTVQIFEHMQARYSQFLNQYFLDSQNHIHSLIWKSTGFLVIYTTDTNFELTQKTVIDFLEKWVDDFNHLQIGFGLPKTSLQSLGNGIRESFYANISCRLDKERILSFNQLGLDSLIIPLRNNIWVTKQYDRMLSTLVDYDKKHNTNLKETLYQYIVSNGDITLTANILYQHSNTIRYRLSKIKELLGITDSIDSYPQLYYFVRLNQVKQLLNEEDYENDKFKQI